MADKPIIFSAPMIRALLDGRKTQTRRLVKYDKCGAPIMPYDVGYRLWVKEAWQTSPAYDDLPPSGMGGDESIFYTADGSWESWGWGDLGCVSGGRKRSQIHMPRWASRLTLTLTDVRVQRVQEIIAEDCEAEGVHFERDALAPAELIISRFRDLWNSIHGPTAWNDNPWVCALTFDVHRCNIDQMDAQDGR